MSVAWSILIGLLGGASISALILVFMVNYRLSMTRFEMMVIENKMRRLENQNHELLRKYEMMNRTGSVTMDC